MIVRDRGLVARASRGRKAWPYTSSGGRVLSGALRCFRLCLARNPDQVGQRALRGPLTAISEGRQAL